MGVFGAYLEMTQDIRHYAAGKGWGEAETSAIVVIAHNAQGRYVVSAGNVVDAPDGQLLAAMDKVQPHGPRDQNARSGAGLGLIDMARKASEALACSVRECGDGRAFFCLRVVLEKDPRGAKQ